MKLTQKDRETLVFPSETLTFDPDFRDYMNPLIQIVFENEDTPHPQVLSDAVQFLQGVEIPPFDVQMAITDVTPEGDIRFSWQYGDKSVRLLFQVDEEPMVYLRSGYGPKFRDGAAKNVTPEEFVQCYDWLIKSAE